MTTLKRVSVAAVALILAACSFEVTNPGPVEDAALDDPGAYDALVRGVRYNLSRAVSISAFYGAVAAKEYSTSGRVNATKLPLIFGQLSVDDVNQNAWNWSHAARWQAEDGIRRLREVQGAGFDSDRHGGQLLMYAALANRVLGECMCESVIDGGPKASHTVHLTRAEEQATEAIAVATAAGDDATVNAAHAVRASVRLYLEDFANAAADAAMVPDDFELFAPFDDGTQNVMVSTNDFAVGGSFRAHTVWRTFFEDYYRTTGDPRVRWDSSTTEDGVARDGEFSGIVWYYQQKYTQRGSAIRLVSGHEMRLLEAEVALRSGAFPAAMTLINDIRTIETSDLTGVALDPWPGSTVAEAWDALFHERRIELWLEGRSMGDLRRWIADGTYGTNIIPDPDSEDVANRVRLCLPITRNERTRNPNLQLDPDDPVSAIFDGSIAPW